MLLTILFAKKPIISKDKNIVVVSFDALRADALGVYGYTRGTSPNIDDSTLLFHTDHAILYNLSEQNFISSVISR